MKNDIQNKLIRKKVIWVEIGSLEQEFKRLQKQINNLQDDQQGIMTKIKKRLDENEKISEFLNRGEYNHLTTLRPIQIKN